MAGPIGIDAGEVFLPQRVPAQVLQPLTPDSQSGALGVLQGVVTGSLETRKRIEGEADRADAKRRQAEADQTRRQSALDKLSEADEALDKAENLGSLDALETRIKREVEKNPDSVAEIFSEDGQYAEGLEELAGSRRTDAGIQHLQEQFLRRAQAFQENMVGVAIDGKNESKSLDLIELFNSTTDEQGSIQALVAMSDSIPEIAQRLLGLNNSPKDVADFISESHDRVVNNLGGLFEELSLRDPRASALIFHNNKDDFSIDLDLNSKELAKIQAGVDSKFRKKLDRIVSPTNVDKKLELNPDEFALSTLSEDPHGDISAILGDRLRAVDSEIAANMKDFVAINGDPEEYSQSIIAAKNKRDEYNKFLVDIRQGLAAHTRKGSFATPEQVNQYAELEAKAFSLVASEVFGQTGAVLDDPTASEADKQNARFLQRRTIDDVIARAERAAENAPGGIPAPWRDVVVDMYQSGDPNAKRAAAQFVARVSEKNQTTIYPAFTATKDVRVLAQMLALDRNLENGVPFGEALVRAENTDPIIPNLKDTIGRVARANKAADTPTSVLASSVVDGFVAKNNLDPSPFEREQLELQASSDFTEITIGSDTLRPRDVIAQTTARLYNTFKSTVVGSNVNVNEGDEARNSLVRHEVLDDLVGGVKQLDVSLRGIQNPFIPGVELSSANVVARPVRIPGRKAVDWQLFVPDSGGEIRQLLIGGQPKKFRYDINLGFKDVELQINAKSQTFLTALDAIETTESFDVFADAMETMDSFSDETKELLGTALGRDMMKFAKEQIALARTEFGLGPDQSINSASLRAIAVERDGEILVSESERARKEMFESLPLSMRHMVEESGRIDFLPERLKRLTPAHPEHRARGAMPALDARTRKQIRETKASEQRARRKERNFFMKAIGDAFFISTGFNIE